MSSQADNAFLPLKLISFSLSLIWGFVSTFVLIRIFSPEEFALLAVVTAFGLSLGIADFGISRVLISDSVSEPEHRGNNVSGGVLILYFLGCVVFTALFSIIVNIGEVSIGRAQVVCYFLSSALNLPWKLLQNISLITSEYLRFELIELLRRGLLIFSLFILFASHSFEIFVLTQLVIWLFSFLIAIHFLKRELYPKKESIVVCLNSTWMYLRSSYRKLKDSVVFHINEFLIYQSLTLVTPLIYGLGISVVQVDTFYKLHRSSTQLFRVGTESRVPAIVKLMRENRRKELWADLIKLFVIPFIFFTVILFVLAGFGDDFLNLLLDNKVEYGAPLVVTTLIFIAANCLQNSAGTMQLLWGKYRTLRIISSAVLAAIIVLYAIALIFSLELIWLIRFYTYIYSLGALAYFVAFLRSEGILVSL